MERRFCGAITTRRIFKFRRTKTKAGDIAVRSSDGGSAGGVCAELGMRGKKLLKAGLSLLLGGAFSNTYDRVMREYVVD